MDLVSTLEVLMRVVGTGSFSAVDVNASDSDCSHTTDCAA